jgi:hypothetical protein
VAERLGVKVGEKIVDMGGYLLSYLGSFGWLHPFEAELVTGGCVVLTEMGFVVEPPEAVEAYNAAVAEWAAGQAERKCNAMQDKGEANKLAAADRSRD